MKKKIFVTGSNGLIGSRFVELLSDKYELITPEIDKLDLTQRKAVSDFVSKEAPDIVVHFAAYTDVSEAEKNQRGDRNGSCWKVNVEATNNLVESVDPQKTHFIHISTDMVFSGKTDDPGPYKEKHPLEDDLSRLTWYGWTKAKAEEVVKSKLSDKYSIIRLAYPVRAKFDGKLDYIKGPLKLFDEGKLYPLFTDQMITITFIDDITDAISRIIQKKLYGIFHIASVNTTSPNELISYVLNKTGRYKGKYKGSSIYDYLENNKDAHWPILGGLDAKETVKVLGIRGRTWGEIVDELVTQGLK